MSKSESKSKFKPRRTHKIILAFLAFAALAWANGLYLSPRDDLQQADAVVAISGGDTRARTLLPTEVYHQGWTQRVIFSGAAYDPGSPSNAAAMRNIAVESGVPSQIISLSENAANTSQNASEVTDILARQRAQRIILVTSEYHQRRAHIEFTKELQAAGLGDVEIINYPAHESGWSALGWWTTRRGWWLTMGENSKIITGFFSQIGE